MGARHSLKRSLAVVAALGFGLIAISGCSKSTEPAVSDCEAKVAEAAQALEGILYEEINSDPQRPSDLAFQSAYALYQDALQCDATSADANLGVAVLGLMALTSDAEVNGAFDEWEAYLEAHTPFEVPATRARPLGVPMSFARGPDALRLPFELASWSVLALAQPRRAVADPQLGRVQAILETRVVPRLDQALARLAVAASRTDYRFVVTPRMQGDEGASPVEIDRTDILALRAACGLLASACHTAVAYDFNFTAYDSLSLLQALTPGSGWMALRSQGAGHMASAGVALSGAVDDLDGAITSLLGETDSQDDDVIKIGPDDVSAAQAESIQVHLDDVRAGLAQGYTRTDDWDGNPGTPDVPLTIRIGSLFTNPVPDWKALLPDYVPTVERRSGQVVYQYGSGYQTASLDVPSDAYYSASYSFSVSGIGPQEYFYGDEVLRAALTQIVQDGLAVAQATPHWTGTFGGYATFSGPLVAGTQDIQVYWYSQYAVVASYRYVPIITWEAATFDEWIWPDPTLHGLLPGMGSSSQLLETFGITASDWSPQVVFERDGGALVAARQRRLR